MWREILVQTLPIQLRDILVSLSAAIVPRLDATPWRGSSASLTPLLSTMFGIPRVIVDWLFHCFTVFLKVFNYKKWKMLARSTRRNNPMSLAGEGVLNASSTPSLRKSLVCSGITSNDEMSRAKVWHHADIVWFSVIVSVSPHREESRNIENINKFKNIKIMIKTKTQKYFKW